MSAPLLDPPVIVQTRAQAVAVIHLTVPRAQIAKVMGPARAEVNAALAAQNIAPVGAWFSHHLRMDPAVFDFEIGVPVDAPLRACGRVFMGELPAARVARTVYRGPYEGLGAAWGEFMAWIARNGHRHAPDLWECYASGSESGADTAQWRTELNRPLLD